MIGLRALVVVAIFACSAPAALADDGDFVAPSPDAAQPAVGEWVGNVSWNAPIVRYGWTIYPDGTFSSGRVERGESGGGRWSMHGAHLTLKYSDRFRYEGEVRGDVYAGTAYAADGHAFGDFSMSRAVKTPDSAEDDDH